MTHPVPQPRKVPFLGNLTSIDREAPTNSYMLLYQQYGEIFRLDLTGRTVVVISSYNLLHEVCDDKRFSKAVVAHLKEIGGLVHDGLFTAQTEDKNWGIAHRLLMPVFGAAAIRDMFPAMEDIISQLVNKWERFGPEYLIDPARDYTKLTLDAISLASMSYRMNSFYSEDMVPFVAAMNRFLSESQLRSNRPRLATAAMISTQAQFEADAKLMTDIAKSIVQKRKANPTAPGAHNDLLDRMLTAVDTKSGEKMSDDSIVDNLITFLIAGHETTSAMLTFVTYEVLKHPEVLLKLRAEIDEVLGDRMVSLEDLPKMPYTLAVMRETLRLRPPASTRSVHPKEATTLGNGKYFVTLEDNILVNVTQVHRDPEVWGDDGDLFKPERMLDGKFEALPPNAWHPFGFGLRACIGRGFALQEAQMAVATIFQRFDLVFDDPSYTLRLKQTVTIKPVGFYIRAYPRNRSARLYATPSSAKLPTQINGHASASTFTSVPSDASGKIPLYLLYGSNSGTCESFAQRIASDAPGHGFRPSIGTLDSAAEKIPSNGPVIIITASFEGEPADNAAYFFKWLSGLQGNLSLSNIKYAVFGCGNRDWVQTYQRIPKLIDELIANNGGNALVPRGEGDAGGSELFHDFDNWEENLFKKLMEEYSTTSSISVPAIEIKESSTGTERAATLRQTDAEFGEVISNAVLTAHGKPVKRHIEFELPVGQTYAAGDYLAILPVNPIRDVKRILSHFRLPAEQEITLSSNVPSSLPVGQRISFFGLLSGYAELSQPATPRNLRNLLKSSKSEAATQALDSLLENYAKEVLEKRVSVLDILEANSDIQPTFTQFLEMLPPMRTRQYSISSSPLWNPQHVTLTVSIIKAPPLSGKEEEFMGVASTYLGGLQSGDKVQMAVRPSNTFHLPADPSIPVVMIAAGSGIAPMHGFIQERALQKESGRGVGKMLLFFGCRSPGEDYLYSETDINEWTKSGLLEVRPAFSRDATKSEGAKYVQDRVWQDKDVIRKWFRENASYYFCGSGKVALGVKDKLSDILLEARGGNKEEAATYLAQLSKGSRFATDIFD